MPKTFRTVKFCIIFCRTNIYFTRYSKRYYYRVDSVKEAVVAKVRLYHTAAPPPSGEENKTAVAVVLRHAVPLASPRSRIRVFIYIYSVTPRAKAEFRSVNPLYLLHIAPPPKYYIIPSSQAHHSPRCIRRARRVRRAGCPGGGPQRRPSLPEALCGGGGDDDSGQCRVVSPGSAPHSPHTRHGRAHPDPPPPHAARRVIGTIVVDGRPSYSVACCVCASVL